MTMKRNAHVRLRVEHRTRFDYSGTITNAHNEVRKTPIDTGLQRVISSSLQVLPETKLKEHRDHFGNRVYHFNILEPHDFLDIVAESVVETTNAICCGPESSPDPRPYTDRWSEFLNWSAGVPHLAEYSSVAHNVRMDMDEDDFEASLIEVAKYFFSNFRYDKDVTHVHSSPKELFEHGGGVCQDMAHALIGVLRLAGIPARYVSGYIYDSRIDSEEGVHLRGSAATHAWVQAWHEKFGWVGIDPTNDTLVDWQYVRTAIGRDYFDVQPIRGIFHGKVDQQLDVSVHVRRLDPDSD